MLDLMARGRAGERCGRRFFIGLKLVFAKAKKKVACAGILGRIFASGVLVNA